MVAKRPWDDPTPTREFRTKGKALEVVKSEEPKVKDPSVDFEPDLRLTMKEWVLYWKVRYESSFEKIQKAAQFIDSMKAEMKKVMAENKKLQERIDQMQQQYDNEVRERQAKQTEGRPEPLVKSKEPELKAFKRKKRKA